jgi:hypothetical protein
VKNSLAYYQKGKIFYNFGIDSIKLFTVLIYAMAQQAGVFVTLKLFSVESEKQSSLLPKSVRFADIFITLALVL